MNRIERIQVMEENLDRCTAALKEMEKALDVFEESRRDYRRLVDYYGSTQWMRDFEADEAGKLPADLKRGVLSEDAVYDLITDHHELIVRMMKLLTNEIDGK